MSLEAILGILVIRKEVYACVRVELLFPTMRAFLIALWNASVSVISILWTAFVCVVSCFCGTGLSL